jgi:hypothetical protein
MRITPKTSLAATGVFLLVAMGTPVLAGAVSSHANAHAQAATTTANQPGTPGSPAGTGLAAAKLRSCQNREKAINNIMTRIADRGQKQVDLFTTIATRVETFYTAKGKTLSNYDALVSDVNTQKAAAQTEVDALKASSVTFKCDGTDPKGAAQSFKSNLKAEIDALKAYKTAVKNLIVGVKSVQGSTTSTDNSQGGQ